MNLLDVVNIAVLHNLDPLVSIKHPDHMPGKLCLHIQEDGIHYALCKKNYDCRGADVWGKSANIIDVLKFIHSTYPKKICRYCTVTA